MGIRDRLAERWIGDKIDKLQESFRDLEDQLLLEDKEWLLMSEAAEQMSFSVEARDRIQILARTYWTKNPLAGRAVDTVANYTFGRGLSVVSDDEKINNVIKRFWKDQDNLRTFTGNQAQHMKCKELQVDGEVFFALFTNEQTGTVKIASIPAYEIRDVIRDPENRFKPMYYRRQKIARLFSFESESYESSESKSQYIRDWLNQDGEDATEEGVSIYHLKTNCLSDSKFGVSELYRAIDWLKSYNKYLENWASVAAALARFAWKKKIKGGASTISSIKSQMEDAGAPPAGSTLLENLGVDHQPIRTAGANASAADGRYLKLMICAASGIFEHYFGDPSTGNLATSTAMELPMLKMFESNQQKWIDTYSDIVQYVIERAIDAGELEGFPEEDGDAKLYYVNFTKDSKTEKVLVDDSFEVVMPPIVQKDVPALVESIVKAVTLGQAGNRSGLMPMDQAVRLVLNAFNIENPDQVIEDMDLDKQDEQAKEQEIKDKVKQEQLAQQKQVPQQPPGPQEEFEQAVVEMGHSLGALIREAGQEE